MLLPLATVPGLTGYSYALGPGGLGETRPTCAAAVPPAIGYSVSPVPEARRSH
jgi:hypothetical protein